MGRNIPVFVNHEQVLVAPHPALSLSLMILAMAATMAMITGMCGFRRRRTTRSTPSSPKQSKDQQNEQDSPHSSENDQENLYQDDQDESLLEDMDGATSSLPLPPSMQGLDGSNLPQIKSRNKGITKSMSTRNMKRLKSSLNTKVTRSMSMNMRHINKAAHNVAHKGHKAAHNVENIIAKPKQEDSLWQKQIILGEKCRVPADDDGIIYDPKGNRVSTFHKKTTSSLSMTISRTTSSVDLNVIDREKDIGKKLEMENPVQTTEKREEESW